LKIVEAFGGEARFTSADCACGTDRVAQVARALPAQAFINVQGDEPLIHSEAVALVARALSEGEDMVTLRKRMGSKKELFSPHVVKVVVDSKGYALYFSRSPIPCPKGGDWEKIFLPGKEYYKHIGVYGYKREVLLALAGFPQSPLEEIEGLEQLRALDNGIKVRVLETDYDSISVDVPEDVIHAEVAMEGETR
jgi:3-deoxy-manno-octulosonate cytidylyltransferase (CMP-KDO synthetase)